MAVQVDVCHRDLVDGLMGHSLVSVGIKRDGLACIGDSVLWPETPPKAFGRSGIEASARS